MKKQGTEPHIICPGCNRQLTRRKRFCIFCSYDLSTIKGYFDKEILPPGFVINKRYRVKEYMTSGGMANVYQVMDTRLEKIFCLKEMIDDFKADDERERAVIRFKREASILFELRHPAIPRMIDQFVDGNRYYLVMEYVNGRDLESILKEQPDRRIPQERIIKWLWQMVDVLTYLHSREPRVIYRDLKPSNILATEQDQVFLIDFGIARTFMPRKKGTLIGTPGYAPPEQYKGQVDHRSDIYALGATLHQLISGKDPRQEIPFNFKPIKKLMPDLDDSLAQVVDGSLTYGVNERLQNVREISSILSASEIVNQANVFYNQGIALMKEGKIDKAEDAFTRSLSVNPNNAYAYSMRASVREQREIAKDESNYNSAIEDYEKAISIQPDNPEFYDSLAMLQRKAGYYEDAMSTLEKVLELDPGFFEAAGDLGSLHIQRGNLEKAIRYFKKALAANPSFIQARENLEQARRQLRIRRFDQKSTEEIDPRKAYYKLAMYFMEFDRYQQAEDEFRKALKNSPDDPDIYRGLGDLMVTTGRHDEALSYYKEGQALAPDCYLLYLGVARAHYKNGKLETAMKHLLKGIKVADLQGKNPWNDPDFHRMLQFLIDLLTAMGRDSQQQRDMQAALDSGVSLKESFNHLWDSLKGSTSLKGGE